MRMRSIFATSSLVVVVVAGGAGYIWWELRQSDNTRDRVATTTHSGSEQPAPLNNTPVDEQRLQVKGATNTMGQLPQQQPTNGQPDPQAQSTSLPEPTEFGVYEEYASAEGPLYIDVEEGTGKTAEPGARVAMYYQGWLTDGTLFDQTRADQSGEVQPFVFELGAGQVIAGWDQGIAGMKEGGKRRLVIPAPFAYGETGQGPIPPNSLLVFDVQLVAIQ